MDIDPSGARRPSTPTIIASVAALLAAAAIVGVVIVGNRSTTTPRAAATTSMVPSTVTATVTATAPAVRLTITRTVTKTRQPPPTAQPIPTPQAAPLDCKVEQFGPNNLEFEVTPGVPAYLGSAQVTLTMQSRGITFPDSPVVTVHPAGSDANWHTVPADDEGANAAPDSCTAVPN